MKGLSAISDFEIKQNPSHLHKSVSLSQSSAVFVVFVVGVGGSRRE